MEKQALRKKLLQERLEIVPDAHALLSETICNKLFALGFVQNARRIMAYCTHQNEPDLMAFMHACLDSGKCVSLPYVIGEGQMIPVDFDKECKLQENAYGIPEPVLKNDCDPLSPDVVIVPGIAYDNRLHRVGFGGGFYDRYLASTSAVKIGVCFDAAIVSSAYADSHDVAMDMVVTEKRSMGAR